MFEIVNRYTHALLYKSETATNVKAAIIEAVKEGADLRDACLEGADLRGACLEGAYLEGAYLRGAYLRGAYLRDAYLRGACLEGAYLEGADLRDACLEGADLRDADLRGADLRGAYLRGACLRGADLRGAKGLLSKGTNPLHIGGSRHWIIVREDGYVTVGCIHRPLVWWESEYARVGKVEGYNETAIAEYKRHIAYCRAWMELHGVVEVIVKADASETV